MHNSLFPPIYCGSFRGISHYAMADTSHAVYLIGSEGLRYLTSNNAKFHFDQTRGDVWQPLPNLKNARHSHASIMIGKNIVNVGGKTLSDHSVIEIWDFETSEAMIVDPSPENPDSYKTKIYKGIAIFPVNSDFCKK